MLEFTNDMILADTYYRAFISETRTSDDHMPRVRTDMSLLPHQCHWSHINSMALREKCKHGSAVQILHAWQSRRGHAVELVAA